MRKLTIFILIVFISNILFAQYSGKKQKILIAYFTWAQNKDLSKEVDTSTHASVKLLDKTYKGDTEIVAEWINQEIGGDLFGIKTANKYSNNFNQAVEEAGRELRRNARPELITYTHDISKYDIIFLGYPMWHRDVPMAVYTFLESYNLSGKIIVPFSTHMGGGLGTSVGTIRKLEPKATILEAIMIYDGQIFEYKKKVKEWLDKIGF